MQALIRTSRFFWRTWRLEMSSAIEYRGSLAGWVVLAGAPVIAHYILWSAIFEQRGDAAIAGMNFSHIITYQILAVMLFQLLGPWSMHGAISDEIRSGEINRYLLRPIPYRLFRAARYIGYNSVYLMLAAGPVAIVLLALGDDFVFAGWRNLSLGVIAAVIGGAIQFMAAYCMALLAFWFDDTRSVFVMFMLSMRFVAGEMLPLQLLPEWAFNALSYMPFPNIIWFPLQLYMGTLDGAHIAHFFINGLVWVGVLWLLGYVMWQRGIRRYGAFGG